MKLHRISLQEFRKFRDSVAIEGLTDGLNVIAGPNEAGKSTLATAIRAAFLERYKTTKVADLAPWGMSGARPSVELTFEHDGHQYLLRKSFLSRARCELVVDDGTQRHEGEAAENVLAGLLGFEFSAKGGSRPEHGGIPGLLWISQGEGQNLLEPAGHAQTHVRDALTRLTGELTSADGDSLYERVDAERAALRDGRSGRPKGAYKDAEEALARARQDVATLTAARQALDADVDRLATLRRDYDQAQQDQPWLALEQRAAEARARLVEISREQEAFTELQRALAQAEDTLALLHDQVNRDQQDADALSALQSQAEAAEAGVGPARDALDRAVQHHQQLAVQLEAASAQVTAAQQAAMHQDAMRQVEQLSRDLQLGRDHIARAEQQVAQVQTLQSIAASLDIDDQALQALRRVEQQLAQLHAQQQAGATRLHHRLLPGQTLRLTGQPLAGQGASVPHTAGDSATVSRGEDGAGVTADRDEATATGDASATLTGEGEALIAQASELDIPGVGVLRIEPGGADLSKTLAALQRAQTEQASLLARLGVSTLAEAESRAASGEQARRDLDMARQTLRIQAPDGVEALRAASAQTQARLQQLQSRLAELPQTIESISLVDAQQARQRLATETEHAAQAVAAARTAWDTQQTTARIYQTQWAARQAEFNAPARLEQREQRGARLVEARATRETIAQRRDAAQAALQALQPELIEQDAQRFEQSARLQRDEQQRRHAELLQLQGKLEQAQAQGVGEQLLQAQAEVERLTRRRDEFATRAQALDLLWQLLGQRRADATQRLLAPLAQRLQHYLGLLFPGATWRLDDALMPTAVMRETTSDGTETLSALSFGTREQLGVLARFAYADLLQQAGRPTLLVLDDTLVHADRDRRELMKRALYDAASRHQILLLTCHGESWQDMGVGVRRLPDGTEVSTS